MTLKLLTNESRGGLKVVWFARSFLKLFTLRFQTNRWRLSPGEPRFYLNTIIVPKHSIMSGSVIVLIVSARLAWCKTYRLIPLSTYLFSRWSVPLKAPGEAFSPTSLLLHELPWLFPFIGEFWLVWIWIRIPNTDPDSLTQSGSKTQIRNRYVFWGLRTTGIKL